MTVCACMGGPNCCRLRNLPQATLPVFYDGLYTRHAPNGFYPQNSRVFGEPDQWDASKHQLGPGDLLMPTEDDHA